MPKRIVAFIVNPAFVLGVLVIGSFILHLFNIGYNSPSNDEAVYINIGQKALFNGQWGLYDTASWVGGHPYFYPTLTVIAYTFGGINGSRLLNVVMGTICLYFVYKLTYSLTLILTKNKDRGVMAGVISSILIGFSATTAYVARLATLDMASFMFIVISFHFLVQGIVSRRSEESAKNFVVSALSMVLSFAFKYIVALYIPVAAVASFLYVRSIPKKSLIKLWWLYFVLPLVLLILILTLTQVRYLLVYIGTQSAREPGNIHSILGRLVKDTISLLPFWIIGAFYTIRIKNWKFLLLVTCFSIPIALFHIISLRSAAWDKHLFLVILPLGIVAGIGTAIAVKNKLWAGILAVLLITYIVFNVKGAEKYNHLWPDYTGALKFMSQNIKKGDNLLTEESSTLLLPANVTTFDWFSYNGQTGWAAYKTAINDGYFNYIELNLGYSEKTQEYQKMEKQILAQINGTYFPIYADNYFTIYRRGY